MNCQSIDMSIPSVLVENQDNIWLLLVSKQSVERITNVPDDTLIWFANHGLNQQRKCVHTYFSRDVTGTFLDLTLSILLEDR